MKKPKQLCAVFAAAVKTQALRAKRAPPCVLTPGGLAHDQPAIAGFDQLQRFTARSVEFSCAVVLVKTRRGLLVFDGDGQVANFHVNIVFANDARVPLFFPNFARGFVGGREAFVIGT